MNSHEDTDVNQAVVGVSNLQVIKSSAGLGWDRVHAYISHIRPLRYSFSKIQSLSVVLILDGEVIGELEDSRATINLNMNVGDIIIFSPNYSFELNLRSSAKIIIVNISEKILRDISYDFYVRYNKTCNMDFSVFLSDVFISEAILLIERSVLNSDLYSGIKIEYICRATVAGFFEKYSLLINDENKVAKGLSQNSIHKVVTFIDENLASPISAEQLAHLVGLGGAQFSRLFKVTMNLTLHQYIIERRVEKAKALLTETDIKIVEIAQECGFSDQVHLTKFFTRVVGITPARFRKKFQF